MPNGSETNRPIEKATEVQPDKNKIDAKDDQERLEAELKKNIREIVGGITHSTGFDARVDNKSDGVTYVVEMTEGGVAKYAIKVNTQKNTFTLEKVNPDNSRTPIEEGKSMLKITFPVSTLALTDLLAMIKKGAMDKGFGTTEFIMKPQKIGDTMRYRFSKVGMLSNTDSFALEHNEKNDTYTLLRYLGKPDRNMNMDSDEYEQIGKPSRNPYDLINNYSQRLLPDTLSEAQLNAGNSCRNAPYLRPRSLKEMAAERERQKKGNN